MTLTDWAAKHGVSAAALRDLEMIMCAPAATIPDPPGASSGEASAQQRIVLEAPKHGDRLFRNNVGATPARCPECGTQRQPVRYGLANDSYKMNREIKSSDLIGIRPVLITPEYVGKKVGVFTSIEVKPVGWRYMGTDHEAAQLKWLQLVQTLGGIATFATKPADVWD